MGTTLKEILDITIALIPKDYRSELMEDTDLAAHGLMEMGVALDTPFVFTEEKSIDEESGKEMAVRGISIDLSMKEKSLASYFTYRCYLMRLKDELNRDAINFKTLTFEIKGLEKRPEAINDSIYQINRYLQTEIDRVKGGSSVIGVVSVFGGGGSA